MEGNATGSTFAAQWTNPAGFLSLLMLIGGPVIQSTLAQVAEGGIAPVCFSFGWISYAFSMITAVIGDGRLMPPPDYSCKVFNLENGYSRTNKSWLIGRLLRDLERPLTTEALCVTVYEATETKGDGAWWTRTSKSTWSGLSCIITQLTVALCPLVLWGDWGILTITAAGTLLALLTTAIPQWRVEKYACRRRSKKIAITTGNGSRNIIVILGEGKTIDLEDLAAAEGPRNGRPWETLGWFLEPVETARKAASSEQKDPAARTAAGQTKPATAPTATDDPRQKVKRLRGLPIPFWLTRICVVVLAVLWAAILITVLAVKKHAWFLVAAGTIGMIQNAVVAAASRNPCRRGIALRDNPMIFIGSKVQDVLMDLDMWEPGCGRVLLKEFFPGELDVPTHRGEQQWWDAKRERDQKLKGVPADTAGQNDGTNQTQTVLEYDRNRYDEKFRGIRYDAVDIEKPGTPSRGRKGGMWGRQEFATLSKK